jgi:hypothetical protein
MKIKLTSVCPSLSVALTLISTLLSLIISVYLCVTPPIRSVNFSIEAFWWRMAAKAMLRGINAMLGVGSLPHHPSLAFVDVSTSVFDRVLVIAILSHILESA